MPDTEKDLLPEDTWKEVQGVLGRVIETLGTTSRSRAEYWLASLGESTSGRRLGTCIAIDLVSTGLSAETVGLVLGVLPELTDDPCADFLTAQEVHPRSDEFAFASQHDCQSLSPSDRYVRVLRLRDFMQYYATKAPFNYASDKCRSPIEMSPSVAQ